MARVRTEGERKGAAKKPSKAVDAKVRKAAQARAPKEQTTLPEVANTETDKALEKYGRELAGLVDAKAANDRMIKACRARIDTRLAELGRHVYRMSTGQVLTVADKRTVKLERKAPKASKPRKRKSEAEGVKS